jgi:hypothetical protein
MLVLSAVFKSQLHFLIERSELVRLLDRTIEFLKRLAPISSTLAVDQGVLEGVREGIDEPLGPT